MHASARLLIALFLGSMLTGCASQNIRPVPLGVNDETLERVENQLGLLAVHISPLETNLKLRGLRLRDSSGHLISFPFFDNVILGSRALPVDIDNGAVRQIALLDLMPGKYEIEEIEFANRQDTGAEERRRTEELDPRIVIQMPSTKVAYLGRLTLIRETEVFVIDEVASGYVVQGFINAGTSNEYDEDTEHARRLYSALRGETISSSYTDNE